MKAISIKQPWASLICTPRNDNPNLGIKNIENRTWATKYRGKVLIHASGSPAKGKFLAMNKKQREFAAQNENFNPLYFEDLPVSAIIGEVEIIDCVINHESVWAEKTEGILNPVRGIFTPLYKDEKIIYNWVLANPVLYEKPILNVKGKLSFWEFEK